MRESTLKMLCCPLCKGVLRSRIESSTKQNAIEGSLFCSDCKKEYSIQKGIPRMFIPDDDVIALSNNEKFSEFIVTPESLDRWSKRSTSTKASIVAMNRFLTMFLLSLGWILLSSGAVLLILSAFHFADDKLSPFVAYLLLSVSIIFFITDYLRYRKIAIASYAINSRTLKELAGQQELGEYHLHIAAPDREDGFERVFEGARLNAALKGEKIASILDSYNFKVENALNVGCGGPLTVSASKPYFDRGYDVMGVDVGEEYLEQYSRIFNTDVVQANGIALPLGNNSFDLVNYTDIIEHLHHPFLGLSEAQRVLKAGGIIILMTPNRCAFFTLRMNPLIFVEKVVSLHCDRILPPRKIVEQWMGVDFYHTEFSKNEITRLVKAAGFEVLSFETQFFFGGKSDRVNKVFRRLPVLRSMCCTFVIIGRKKQWHSENIQL